MSAELCRSARTRPEKEGGLFVWRERFAEDGPLAELAATGLALDDLVFLDLETGGLGDAVVFLAGFLFCGPEGPEIVQWVAPDASREPELVERARRLLDDRPLWVSFNGKSFDVPRLSLRCRRHGMAPPRAAAHRDLLHEARRRWGRVLPDCRLGTLERSLLGLQRHPGDVPGREVPYRYRDFVATGDLGWIEPVVDHNRRDVLALAALLRRIVTEPGPGGESPPRPSVPPVRPAGRSPR